MGEWIDPAVRALEARWPWAVLVVAAVLVVRFAVVPLVGAWRGRP